MNDTQKTQIINMRADGLGYSSIAKALEISENTVKSFCRRNQLSKQSTPITVSTVAVDIFCKSCGKAVNQNDKRKAKHFCSDKCRMLWWNSHRDQVKHKNVRMQKCPFCGKEFQVVGKTERKYCSHSCYINDRFGGKRYDS